MMDKHIKKVIEFLQSKANEVEAVHENYTAEYEKWCRTGKGKKPIPPVALPIAAQYMKNAAKSLEAGLDPERIIQPGDSLETRYAKELEASQALLALLKKEKEE